MTDVDLSGKEEEYVRDLVLWFLNTNKRRHAIILSLLSPHTIQRRHNLHIWHGCIFKRVDHRKYSILWCSL